MVVESQAGPPTQTFCQQKKAQFGWNHLVVYDKDKVFKQLSGGGNFHLVADDEAQITWRDGYTNLPLVVNAVKSALGL